MASPSPSSCSSPSPTPTPARKTLLCLPPEILISCLVLPSRQYGYDFKPPLPPKNVLLVCRHLYGIAAPCLYARLWVAPHATELGQSPLVPFLTARQRSALSLPPWERMADPAWVHELTVLPSEPHERVDSELCRVVSLVLPAMTLRSIRWEGRQNDQGVARAVAQHQKGLERICCRVGGPLWYSGPKGLKEVVSWHDEMFPYDDQEDTAGTGLLQESAETVQTLHLAVGYEFGGIGDVARRILRGVETMPKVRVLRLTGFGKEAVAAIERVVAFGSVEEFQIMRGVGLDGLSGKHISGAHALAGNATARGLVELLNGCACETRRLRDLRVNLVDCSPEDPPADRQPPPPPPPLPNMTVIDALGRRGAALTTLVLAHDGWDRKQTNDVALREKEVGRLVESCPSLEDLSITVELGDIIKISPLLAKLPRLSHLSLNIVHDSPVAGHVSSSAPYRLPASSMALWSIDERHWFHPEDSDWAPVPLTAITPLEVVISHILAAGPPGIKSVHLDIVNTNPESPFHHRLRNGYEMRPGVAGDRRPRGPGDFLNAPPGQRYAWGGGELVVVSWDRFRGGAGRETFVSSAWCTQSFEGAQFTV